jgi:hypothetical protein
MPQVRFEPKIPVFEWGKTVHALDSAATVIAALTKFLLLNLSPLFHSDTFNTHLYNLEIIFREFLPSFIKLTNALNHSNFLIP